MTFYEELRHFADSIGLLAMLLIYLGLCLWPFRPGAKRRTNKLAGQGQGRCSGHNAIGRRRGWREVAGGWWLVAVVPCIAARTPTGRR